jgi:HK97 family phage major capsid protein
MTNANQQIRDRLKEVREKSRELRDRRAAARKERDDAKSAFAGATPGDVKITDMPEFKNAEEAVKNLGIIDDDLADLKIAEDAILKMLGQDQPDSPSFDNDGVQRVQGWSAQNLMASGSPYQQAREQGVFSSSARFGTIQMGQIASREDAVRFMSELPGAPAAPIGTASVGGAIQPDRRGIIAPMLRPLRLLDLIPTGPTDSNSIEYVQITAIPNTVGMQAEGAVKPEAGLTMDDATAPVRTIAGWIKVNRQAMDDTAGLSTLINTLLPYDVRRKIEFQILRGDGTGQNLTGILNTTGVGAPTFVEGDNTADAILRAMTLVILSNQEPNFAALHPIDWQNLLLMREGSLGGARTGQYLYGGPGTMAAATIWGMAITPSVALTQGAPLVGDSMGATLLVREGVNVKTSDSDQDDFVRNRVTVLAEARVALPVWYPSAFAVANTTDPTP